jgi:hypothetical protein
MKRVIIPVILGLGLIIASCNTNSQSRQNSGQKNNKTEMREGVRDTSAIRRDNTTRSNDNVNKSDQTGTKSKDNDRR